MSSNSEGQIKGFSGADSESSIGKVGTDAKDMVDEELTRDMVDEELTRVGARGGGLERVSG